MLVKGPGSPGLSDKIAKISGMDTVEVEHKVFPDGERYLRLLDDVEGEDCVLVQATYPLNNLFDLILLQDAISENGGRSLSVVVPYYSYSRQDKCFRPGEAISARVIADLIQARADSFYTVDIHSLAVLDYFNIPSFNMSAMSLLMGHAETYDPDILLSPDEGGKERVKIAANDAGMEWDHLVKNRIDGNTVRIEPKEVDVDGKTVVILDDIISTGGTMFEASRRLKELGARKVHAGCTHGLFVGDCLQKLKSVCDSIFCTDTVECENSVVSVAPLVAEEITDR